MGMGLARVDGSVLFCWVWICVDLCGFMRGCGEWGFVISGRIEGESDPGGWGICATCARKWLSFNGISGSCMVAFATFCDTLAVYCCFADFPVWVILLYCAPVGWNSMQLDCGNVRGEERGWLLWFGCKVSGAKARVLALGFQGHKCPCSLRVRTDANGFALVEPFSLMRR